MLISTEKFEMLVLRDQHYKLEQGKDKIFDMILGSEDTSSQESLGSEINKHWREGRRNAKTKIPYHG